MGGEEGMREGVGDGSSEGTASVIGSRGRGKIACYPEKVRMDGEQDLPVRSADANMA